MQRNLLKNIDLKKLSNEQKKALLMITVVVVSFILLWLLIYLPARSTVKRLKLELSGVDGQIQQIEAKAGQAGSLEEGIKRLDVNLKNMIKRFPNTEEESIKAFASFAKEAGVKVDSIRPLPKKELLDQNSAVVKIKGKSCYVFPISVSLKGSFTDLVRFTQIVEKKLPAFAIIQKLNINSDPANLQMLNINMDLDLYLLAAN